MSCEPLWIILGMFFVLSLEHVAGGLVAIAKAIEKGKSHDHHVYLHPRKDGES